ncbi:unnamed protein product [Darwinula stevensoni]|uniref:Uncharacterized protein n=1 Tax=Darwinula stevensoni TaxID=69355 RepID=A0A7R9AHS9_9CRUS|nr:unnamed protein product [Darwinula stevensoni]CAG0905126.1 unnamed protein product [Darwinula stevensoni]
MGNALVGDGVDAGGSFLKTLQGIDSHFVAGSWILSLGLLLAWYNLTRWQRSRLDHDSTPFRFSIRFFPSVWALDFWAVFIFFIGAIIDAHVLPIRDIVRGHWCVLRPRPKRHRPPSIPALPSNVLQRPPRPAPLLLPDTAGDVEHPDHNDRATTVDQRLEFEQPGARLAHHVLLVLPCHLRCGPPLRPRACHRKGCQVQTEEGQNCLSGSSATTRTMTTCEFIISTINKCTHYFIHSCYSGAGIYRVI